MIGGRGLSSLGTWAIVFAASGGCAGPLSRAEAQFVDGAYPDAERTLVALEAESRGWREAKRAEYALYRGLTHSALGDGDQAGVWLREAKAIEDAHAGSLSPDDANRLKIALKNSEPMPFEGITP
jgi:hypothetical protein